MYDITDLREKKCTKCELIGMLNFGGMFKKKGTHTHIHQEFAFSFENIPYEIHRKSLQQIF